MSLPGTEIRDEPDRQDALTRGVGSRRRGKRRLLVTAALIASLAAVAGQALAADGWLNSISPGTRLSAKEVQSLTNRGPAGQSTPLPERVVTGVRRLGEMNGFVVYALEFKNLQAHFIWGPAGKRYTCYSASPVGSGRVVGIMSCPGTVGGPFPSPGHPAVDLSLVGADRAHPTMHTIRLTAVVANGISRVGVLGSDGNVYGKTRVSGNVAVSGILPWQADGPTVAYGADGAVVWCRGGRTMAILYAAAGCPQLPAPPPSTP